MVKKNLFDRVISLLLIEDEGGITTPLKLFLEDMGFKVSVIGEIEKDTHDLIAKERPDLIFLDMFLSGNDGKVLCRQIKNDERTKTIPVVMMSAYPNAKEASMSSGADGYMEKPFSISDFLEYIERFVSVK